MTRLKTGPASGQGAQKLKDVTKTVRFAVAALFAVATLSVAACGSTTDAPATSGKALSRGAG